MELLNEVFQQNVEISYHGNDCGDYVDYERVCEGLETSDLCNSLYEDFSEYFCDGLNDSELCFHEDFYINNHCNLYYFGHCSGFDSLNDTDNSDDASDLSDESNASDLERPETADARETTVTSLGCTSRRVFNRNSDFVDMTLNSESNSKLNTELNAKLNSKSLNGESLNGGPLYSEPSDKNSTTASNKSVKVNVKLFNSNSKPTYASNPNLNSESVNSKSNCSSNSPPNAVSNIGLNMTSNSASNLGENSGVSTSSSTVNSSTSTKSTVSSSISKPGWIKVKAPVSKTYHETRELVRNLNIVTVCEEAACPNIGECWSKKHAAFMILGDVCTRACAFCNVKKGRPCEVDKNEPKNIGMAVKQMGLRHVVITSVDRDDLPDGGAFHFVDVIYAIREFSPETTIEVLTPDFLRKDRAYEKIVKARPDVYNHNVETVPRLHPSIRRGARYFNSIKLLYMVKEMDDSIFTKSGMMVGLGETNEEIYQVMDDLRDGGVNFFTIGQYLRPTPKHAEVKRYVTPEEFQEYEKVAIKKGFDMVSASALTRSSYHADSDFEKLKSRMNAKK